MPAGFWYDREEEVLYAYIGSYSLGGALDDLEAYFDADIDQLIATEPLLLEVLQQYGAVPGRGGWVEADAEFLNCRAAARVSKVRVPEDPDDPPPNDRISIPILDPPLPAEECVIDWQCDDGRQCTWDECLGGFCYHTVWWGGNCDDGEVCTVNDQCYGTACWGTDVDCDDGDACTIDRCMGCPARAGDPIPCCKHSAVKCDDMNPCTDDSCENGDCVHTPLSGSCDDRNPCTTSDHCELGACIGTPRPGCDVTSCGPAFTLDREGGAEGVTRSATTYVIVPQGSTCVWLRVYYFSREFPSWTGEESEFNDLLYFRVSGPQGFIGSGSTSVNALHDSFGPGPYPGGNYLVLDTVLSFRSFTRTSDSWLELRASATNIGDGALGSGVAFETNCKSVDLDVDNLAEADEEAPGGILPVNDDDDNNNEDRDWHDYGVLPEEDDLVELTLTADAGLGDTVELSTYIAGSQVRIFESADKSNVIILPKDWPVGAVPENLYVEGYIPGEVGLRLAYDPGQGCEDDVMLNVVRVGTLEWEKKAESGNLVLDPCPNNGGLRIFPGRTSSGDEFPITRRQVDLVATIEPPEPGVMVYFKVWDVDDPFDQLNPAMVNVDLVDNDTSGPDNRGTDPAPGGYTDVTDQYGQARVTITVSMQPGNNYRAAASCIGDAIGSGPGQADQTRADEIGQWYDGNFSGYHVPARWSQMLTVWRKLHVEVDSMWAPDWTNTQFGNIPAGPTFDPANNHAVIQLAGLEPEFNETDQHKVGRIDILTFGSFTTIATTKGSSATVEIINAPANIVTAADMWYTLWDDDAGSTGGFTMVGFDAPPVTLPKVPDTSLMAQVFQNAYVEVPSPDLQYYDSNSPFDHNVASDEAVNAGNANRDLTSAPDYWVVHITSAFQGYVDKDGDPDAEEGLGGPGLQYGITGAPLFMPWRRAGSLVYLETIRDHSRGNSAQMATLERYTVTHEAGHQFKLEHTDGRFPPGDDQQPSGDFIMTDILDQTGMAPNVAFSPTSAKKIREIEYPPQGD